MEHDIIAGAFGKIFILLADDPKPQKKLANKVWQLLHDYQIEYFLMGCDEALIKLGLAYKGVDGLIYYKQLDQS